MGWPEAFVIIGGSIAGAAFLIVAIIYFYKLVTIPFGLPPERPMWQYETYETEERPVFVDKAKKPKTDEEVSDEEPEE